MGAAPLRGGLSELDQVALGRCRVGGDHPDASQQELARAQELVGGSLPALIEPAGDPTTSSPSRTSPPQPGWVSGSPRSTCVSTCWASSPGWPAKGPGRIGRPHLHPRPDPGGGRAPPVPPARRQAHAHHVIACRPGSTGCGRPGARRRVCSQSWTRTGTSLLGGLYLGRARAGQRRVRHLRLGVAPVSIEAPALWPNIVHSHISTDRPETAWSCASHGPSRLGRGAPHRRPGHPRRLPSGDRREDRNEYTGVGSSRAALPPHLDSRTSGGPPRLGKRHWTTPPAGRLLGHCSACSPQPRSGLIQRLPAPWGFRTR